MQRSATANALALSVHGPPAQVQEAAWQLTAVAPGSAVHGDAWHTTLLSRTAMPRPQPSTLELPDPALPLLGAS